MARAQLLAARHAASRATGPDSRGRSNYALLRAAREFIRPEETQEELDFIDAIRNDKPHNEVVRGTKSSLATAMGRMASHTGQIVTYDEMLNCEHEFAPDVDKLTLDGPAPLLAAADGTYPIPLPGLKALEY